MASNLPPGCSSPDGGIDHALETKLEELCELILTGEQAQKLIDQIKIEGESQLHKRERVGDHLYRFVVPGGWIYQHDEAGQISLVFVPDPKGVYFYSDERKMEMAEAPDAPDDWRDHLAVGIHPEPRIPEAVKVEIYATPWYESLDWELVGRLSLPVGFPSDHVREQCRRRLAGTWELLLDQKIFVRFPGEALPL